MSPKFIFLFICVFFFTYSSCVSASNHEKDIKDTHFEIQMLKKMYSYMSEQISDLKNVVRQQDIEIKRLNKKDRVSSNVCGNRSLDEKPETEMKRLLLGSQTTKQVAFYAHLTKNIDHLGNHQPIVFDKVRTNQGNVYNTADGEFTANTAGTYFFIWTISNSDGTTMQSELMVNGIVFGQIISDAANHSDWAVSTSFVVVSLQIGDRVWIRSGVFHNGHVSGTGFGTSSFGGFLLW